MDESEKYSFKGYSFKEWVKHNKNSLKDLAVLLAGFNYLTGFDWKLMLGSLLVVVGKLAVDSIDYFCSE